MDAVDDARFASSAAASRVRSSAGQSHQSFPSSSGVLQMASKSAASLSHVSISGRARHARYADLSSCESGSANKLFAAFAMTGSFFSATALKSTSPRMLYGCGSSLDSSRPSFTRSGREIMRVFPQWASRPE